MQASVGERLAERAEFAARLLRRYARSSASRRMRGRSVASAVPSVLPT